MNAIKRIWSNKWVKFSVVAAAYVLLFVVWTGNLWMLLGLPVVYDVYISRFMYRLFWRRHKELKKKNKAYKTAMDWVEAIVFAVVVTTFIKYFWFAMYVIPSPSMEKTLLVGDYLCVSKLAYGPQVPNTPIAFPLVHNTMPLSATKKSYSEAISWPYHRLKGFGHVKRGDCVVFNFPAGDTVVLARQNETYYDILRAYQRAYGEKEGRARLYREYEIIARPVDRRENYVKRCVGIPGDSIRVEASRLLVNGQELYFPEQQYIYTVRTNGTPISQAALQKMGIAMRDVTFYRGENAYTMPLTAVLSERIAAMPNVADVTQYIDQGTNLDYFPNDTAYNWNIDNMGSFWVPQKGATVELDGKNIALYRRIIGKYEGNRLEERGGEIFINDTVARSYTFRMDYYWMMGDNRHMSADSRFWGFVPEDHIVGKPSFVWLSLDPEKGWFEGKIRWRRMFRTAK